jgi:hypothetical protein
MHSTASELHRLLRQTAWIGTVTIAALGLVALSADAPTVVLDSLKVAVVAVLGLALLLSIEPRAY